MAIGNIPARKRGFGYDPVTRSLGVYVDGALVQSFPPTPGRTYFVNNITGSSTNDGLSWGTAMDEVSTAITASETYRELGGVESGAAVTTNDYVRNTIMVQGTATAYTGLTDLGEYYNLIGLGVPSDGIGGTIWNTTTLTGMARLGSDTASTGGMYDLDGEYQGVYVSNIHFQTGGTNPAFGVDELFQCKFEDCGFFYAMTTAGASPDAWFEIYSAITGLIMNRCAGGSNAGVTDRPAYGFHVKTGADRFTHSRMRDCQWTGSTAAYMVAASVLYGQGTVIGPDNLFGAFGHGVCTCGIKDMGVRSEAQGGQITYIHNYIDAHQPIIKASDVSIFIDNRQMSGAITF